MIINEITHQMYWRIEKMTGIASGALLFPLLIVAFWILGFACLIQLYRFLSRGIKALDLYIADKKVAKPQNDESGSSKDEDNLD
jgi:hypothetical protein